MTILNGMQYFLKSVWCWLDTGRFMHFIFWMCSFFWLVCAVPFLSLHHDGVSPFFSAANKGSQDLANYYMAGSIALAGEWDSLYPVPRAGIQHNAGWPDCSDCKPAYAELAVRKGVENSFRFILPPPSALLFVPLGLIPYPAERWIWVSFLGFCCWGACAVSYYTGRKCGSSRRTALIVSAFWAFSPLMLKALRAANSTPFLAVSLGLAAIGIYENKKIRAAVFCVIAGLLKGTSIIFIPLIVLMKRWGIALLGAALTILISGITAWLGGWSVFIEFFEKIYPTTQTVSPYSDNQSVGGCLYRIFGEVVRMQESARALQLLGWFFAGLLILLICFRRRELGTVRVRFIAATVALLGIHLIFKPYNWGHYALCYIPFWSALLAGMKTLRGKVGVWIASILLWCPLLSFHGKAVMSTEPFSSYILGGEILLVVLATVIFAGTRENSGGEVGL